MVAGLDGYVNAEGAPSPRGSSGSPPRRTAHPAQAGAASRPVAPAQRDAPVPLPAGATPDPSSDGHLSVIDPRSGCEYDFWQFRRTRGATPRAGGTRSTSKLRRCIPGYSARGSGFALMAGVVLPRELARGRIDHALLLSYPGTRAHGPVHPATESDGRTRGRAAIPEGARLQLDPSLDLDSTRPPGLRAHHRARPSGVRRHGRGHRGPRGQLLRPPRDERRAGSLRIAAARRGISAAHGHPIRSSQGAESRSAEPSGPSAPRAHRVRAVQPWR